MKKKKKNLLLIGLAIVGFIAFWQLGIMSMLPKECDLSKCDDWGVLQGCVKEYKQHKISDEQMFSCMQTCAEADCRPLILSFSVSGCDVWSYDTNGDCYIDDQEVIKAHDDWAAGLISLQCSILVIDAWGDKVRNPACDVEPTQPFTKITVSPTTVAYSGTLTITVEARNEQGVDYVGFFMSNGRSANQRCDGSSYCKRTWKYTISKTGWQPETFRIRGDAFINGRWQQRTDWKTVTILPPETTTLTTIPQPTPTTIITTTSTTTSTSTTTTTIPQPTAPLQMIIDLINHFINLIVNAIFGGG